MIIPDMMVESSRTFEYCFEKMGSIIISSQFVKKRRRKKEREDEEIKLTYNCCVK